MTSYILSIKNFLLVCSAAFLFSCDKVEVAEDAGSAGQTIVKIPSSSGLNRIAMDLTTSAQTINVLEVRRDVHNEESLKSTLKVVITEDPDGVTAYNNEHNTNYEILPATVYAADPSNPKTGNNYTLTFEPGEFVKYLKLAVPNSSTLDPNKKYAVSFTAASVEGAGKLSAVQTSTVVEIGLKNQWDGVYSVVSGFVQRYSAPGVPETHMYGGALPSHNVSLVTVGPNRLEVRAFKWADGSTDVGGVAPVYITIDPATNAVTMSSSTSATLTNWAAHENKYDPATKTFYVSFRWNPTSTTREYWAVLRYSRPR